MHLLTPEFLKNARALLRGGENTQDSETDSANGADEFGALNHDMKNDPFQSLMKKIGKLLETGLHEDSVQAFELARSAVLDALYEGRQAALLNEKLAEIIDILHAERELGAVFGKRVLDIGTPESPSSGFDLPAPRPHPPTNGAAAPAGFGGGPGW